LTVLMDGASIPDGRLFRLDAGSTATPRSGLTAPSQSPQAVVYSVLGKRIGAHGECLLSRHPVGGVVVVAPAGDHKRGRVVKRLMR
jgi:hypothetical protein